MTKVRGQGQLQHHFWGNYYATIVIGFQDAGAASDALTLLRGFKAHPSKDNILVFHGGGEDFDKVKAVISSYRVPLSDPKSSSYWGNEDPIDATSRSIDFGPLFEIEVDVIPAEQISLFG